MACLLVRLMYNWRYTRQGTGDTGPNWKHRPRGHTMEGKDMSHTKRKIEGDGAEQEAGDMMNAAAQGEGTPLRRRRRPMAKGGGDDSGRQGLHIKVDRVTYRRLMDISVERYCTSSPGNVRRMASLGKIIDDAVARYYRTAGAPDETGLTGLTGSGETGAGGGDSLGDGETGKTGSETGGEG